MNLYVPDNYNIIGKIIPYCDKKFNIIGKGSTRKVYKILDKDKEYALKVAINKGGINGNFHEMELFKSTNNEILSKCLDIDKNGLWLLSEYCRPLNKRLYEKYIFETNHIDFNYFLLLCSFCMQIHYTYDLIIKNKKSILRILHEIQKNIVQYRIILREEGINKYKEKICNISELNDINNDLLISLANFVWNIISNVDLDKFIDLLIEGFYKKINFFNQLEKLYGKFSDITLYNLGIVKRSYVNSIVILDYGRKYENIN